MASFLQSRGLSRMQKLVLMSLVLSTFVGPALAARRRRPLSFGESLAWVAVAVATYVGLLLFVYPRLS